MGCVNPENIEWFYRWPGFLTVVKFCSSPTLSPLSHLQVVSLSQSSYVSLDHSGGGGPGGGGRAKSYIDEKAPSSIKHVILSGWTNALLLPSVPILAVHLTSRERWLRWESWMRRRSFLFHNISKNQFILLRRLKDFFECATTKNLNVFLG